MSDNRVATSHYDYSDVKVFAITSYHDESDEQLRRNIASVRNQTVITHHILISNGPKRPWIDSETPFHLEMLGQGDDWLPTSRSIGALAARSAEAHFGFWLDADHWIDPQHVELALDLARTLNPMLITTARKFVSADGTDLGEDRASDGATTNAASCYFFDARMDPFLVNWLAFDPSGQQSRERFVWNTWVSNNIMAVRQITPTVITQR